MIWVSADDVNALHSKIIKKPVVLMGYEIGLD